MECFFSEMPRSQHKSIILRLAVLMAAVGFALEENALVSALTALVKSIHTHHNFVAANPLPGPFVVTADVRAGVILLCVGVIVIPLAGDHWLGRYSNKVSLRIAFVLAILISAWFSFF